MRTLILGDIGTGKTALTVRLLKEALASVGPKQITIIDMAPEQMQFDGARIGGRVDRYLPISPRFKILTTKQKIHAPRIEGRDANDVRQLAKDNADLIEPLLIRYQRHATPILFVNDASIYLQSGSVNTLMNTVAFSHTFVANAYSGGTLEADKRSGVTEREQVGLDVLKTMMNKIIPLGNQKFRSIDASIMHDNRQIHSNLPSNAGKFSE